MPQVQDMIRELYAAFNRRDVDAVLARLAPDVVWANGMEGGYVHGREAVRAYWARQFAVVRSTVEPGRVDAHPDGRVVVAVHQVVRSAAGGELLADEHVEHVFTLDDAGVVRRFDLTPR